MTDARYAELVRRSCGPAAVFGSSPDDLMLATLSDGTILGSDVYAASLKGFQFCGVIGGLPGEGLAIESEPDALSASVMVAATPFYVRSRMERAQIDPFLVELETMFALPSEDDRTRVQK